MGFTDPFSKEIKEDLNNCFTSVPEQDVHDNDLLEQILQSWNAKFWILPKQPLCDFDCSFESTNALLNGGEFYIFPDVCKLAKREFFFIKDAAIED